MTESSEPVDAPPPPTSGYPTPPPGYGPNPGYSQGPGYPPGPGYAQGAAYAQGAGYPPNAAYTPYQSYGHPYAYPSMPPMPLPNGKAITGMVLGIVGAVTSIFEIGGVIGIVGLIFSMVALQAIRRREAGGRGMAIAGLVTSIVAILVTAAEIILLVLVVHTANTCAQFDPETNPAQYNQCMQGGILGS